MSEENWRDALPEQLRDAPFLGKAESVDDAVGKLAHAAQLVGSSVRIPGSDATDEAREQFFTKLNEVDGVTRLPTHDDIEGVVGLLKKLGYPEDHTGYKLPEVADFTWDETMGESLRQYAHKAGMTPGQFDAFASQIAQQEADADRQSLTALEESRKEVRLDWGETLEERESLIRGWLEHSDAPESMKTLLKEKNLPLDTMNWLYATAKQFKGEVTPLTADGQSPQPKLSPGEIHEKLQRVRLDLYNMTESDPRYKELQAEMVRLHKVAHSPEAA